MVAASDFVPQFLKNQAAELLCNYMAQRGGGAIGAFAGGAAGSYFGPAGAARGARIGSVLGAAGGAALGSRFCPSASPENGEFPYKPTQTALGKCPTMYKVSFNFVHRYSVFFGSPVEFICFAERDIMGPLNGFIIQFPGTLVGGQGNGQAAPISYSLNGVASVNSFFTSDPNLRQKNSGNNQAIGPASNLVITRIDGLPDNCAPPAQPQIPGVGTDIPPLNRDPFARRNINVDVDFGGTTINLDGDLTIDGPNINPGGDLEICYNFDGLIFCIDTNGNIRIGPGSRQTPNDPTAPQPPPGDDNRKELKGLQWDVQSVAGNQSFDLTNGDRYYYPRVGSVQFVGGNKRSEHIQMNADRGFLENPDTTNFDAFSFTPYHPPNQVNFVEVWGNSCCLPGGTTEV